MNQKESEALKSAFDMLPKAFTNDEGTDIKMISYSLLETIVEKIAESRYTEGVINGHKSSAAIVTSVMESMFKKPITETPTLP